MGTRNALCCHRRRSADNLHDFSVSAQQSASRIIHSSFDLDGRHSTASHSFGLHLDVSRAEAFPSSPSVARPIHLSGNGGGRGEGERSVLEILFHLAPAERKITSDIRMRRTGSSTPFHPAPRLFKERYIRYVHQSSCAALADKFPRVIY